MSWIDREREVMTNVAKRAEELLELIIEEGDGVGEVGRRILANRIVPVLARWLPSDKKAKPHEIEPFSDKEAKQFGAELMVFGKHVGERIDTVDLQYLQWLADASRDTWRGLHRYLNNPAIQKKLQSGESEDD